jgi:hypothetical protein
MASQLEKSTTENNNKIENFQFENFLERLSSKKIERKKCNIADVLIDYNWNDLNKNICNNSLQMNTNGINGEMASSITGTEYIQSNESDFSKESISNTYETKLNNFNHDHFNGSEKEWELYLSKLEKLINQLQNLEQINIENTLTPTAINIIEVDNEEKNWNKEVSELEFFFNSIKLPTNTIWVNEFGKLENVSRFVNNEIMICKTMCSNNCTSRPYANLNELKRLRKYLEEL